MSLSGKDVRGRRLTKPRLRHSGQKRAASPGPGRAFPEHGVDPAEPQAASRAATPPAPPAAPRILTQAGSAWPRRCEQGTQADPQGEEARMSDSAGAWKQERQSTGSNHP